MQKDRAHEAFIKLCTLVTSVDASGSMLEDATLDFGDYYPELRGHEACTIVLTDGTEFTVALFRPRGKTDVQEDAEEPRHAG